MFLYYFSMQCIDDGGYLKFVILEDVIEDIPGPVNKILRLFHTKVGTEHCLYMVLISQKSTSHPLHSCPSSLKIIYVGGGNVGSRKGGEIVVQCR